MVPLCLNFPNIVGVNMDWFFDNDDDLRPLIATHVPAPNTTRATTTITQMRGPPVLLISSVLLLLLVASRLAGAGVVVALNFLSPPEDEALMNADCDNND